MLPQLNIRDKISRLTSTSGRKDWQTVHDDLTEKLNTQRDKLMDLQVQLGQTVLLSEGGDIEAQVQSVNLQNEIAAAKKRISDLEAGLIASQDAEVQSKMNHAEDAEKKRMAQIKRVCGEFEKACADLDKSFATTATRYIKAQELQMELQKHCGRGSTQVNEDIAKPLRNFERCMASHLPHNVGPAKIDNEPLPMASLTPKFDHIKELIKPRSY